MLPVLCLCLTCMVTTLSPLSSSEGPGRANVPSWSSDVSPPELSMTPLLSHHCSVAEMIDFEVGGYVSNLRIVIMHLRYQRLQLAKRILAQMLNSKSLLISFGWCEYFFKRPSLKWWKRDRWKLREPCLRIHIFQISV